MNVCHFFTLRFTTYPDYEPLEVEGYRARGHSLWGYAVEITVNFILEHAIVVIGKTFTCYVGAKYSDSRGHADRVELTHHQLNTEGVRLVR